MKTKLYNREGNITGECELPASLFERAVVPTLVHSVAVASRANARVAIAHTKFRGEVRGGGIKPWKQKGTGRARHGSTRSPIWIGGGVVGGPRSDQNFSVKINRKVRRAVLAMALSDRATNERVIVLDNIDFPESKTKMVAAMLAKLPVGKKILLVLPKSTPAVLRAAKNIARLTTVTAESVSILDVLGNDTVLMPQDTISALVKHYVS